MTAFARTCLTHCWLIIELTDDDIRDIDIAGAIGARRLTVKTFLRRGVAVALVGAAALGVGAYLGIDIL